MSLKVILESFRNQPEGISFQCDQDGETIECGVASDVLLDLIASRRLEDSGANALYALLPEIERLANAKSSAGRFEEDGMLVIRTVDLLRFGFQAKSGNS